MSGSSEMKTEIEIFDSIKERVEIRDGGVYWVYPYQSRNIGRLAGVKDKNGYRRMHVGKGRMNWYSPAGFLYP